jgi:hypothetical protein
LHCSFNLINAIGSSSRLNKPVNGWLRLLLTRAQEPSCPTTKLTHYRNSDAYLVAGCAGVGKLTKVAATDDSWDMGLCSLLRLRRAQTWGWSKAQTVFIAAIVLWIPAVGVGVGVLLKYSNTPGRLAAPPPEWPQRTGLRRVTGESTLLVFAHPQCPCSRATIGELALVVAHHSGKFDTYVLVYAPQSMGEKWVRSELWNDAAAIPGVRVIKDPDGLEVRRFGASTSGQTLLYDAGGHLIFNGGITAARGHLGANDGMDAVESMLEHRTTERHTAPVFGCSLIGLGDS